MKRKQWPAWLATGAAALSLLLVGCARDPAEPTAGPPTAPKPAGTTDTQPSEKLATVTLNVRSMT